MSRDEGGVNCVIRMALAFEESNLFSDRGKMESFQIEGISQKTESSETENNQLQV